MRARGTGATAASTGSGTRSCGSTTTGGAALALCRALGPRAAPDCAQGAYHDYWFAVVGADTRRFRRARTRSAQLCAASRRSCARAGTERSSTTGRRGSSSIRPMHLDVLCRGLAGLQREACITGAAVIGPADPEEQLELCAARGPREAATASAERRRRTCSARRPPPSSGSRPLRALRRGARTACYRWLGKTVAVVTDGAFEREGCPLLDVRGPPVVPGGRPRARRSARDVQLSLMMW